MDGCDTDYRIGDQLGKQSANGKVYQSCCDENGVPLESCKHITKTVSFDRYITPETFMKEVGLQYNASLHHIAPKIFKVTMSDTEGRIVMEKLEYTLKDALKVVNGDQSKIESLAVLAVKVLNELHRIGIVHNDAHLNNFMIDQKGFVKMIDFGEADSTELNDKMKKEDYYWITDYFKKTDEYKDIEGLDLFAEKVKEEIKSSFRFKPKRKKNDTLNIKYF
jgi:serine/threonine protein kinase